MMRKFIPHPWLTLLLTLIWLFLAQTYTVNSLLLGLFLGLVIPVATAAYWPNRPRLRNPRMIVEYAIVVFYDIVVANVIVSYIILFKRNADLQSVFVTVPLELRTPEAITVLASTITLTPGTVTSDLSSEGHALLVHCLHAPDPEEVVDQIKTRYERRLMEIFE